MIADREELALFQAIAAEQFDELHLHGVGVLQLVEQHELVALAECVADLLIVADEVAGEREQVLEIERPGSMLAGTVLIIHRQSDAKEVLPEGSGVRDTLGLCREETQNACRVRPAGR